MDAVTTACAAGAAVILLLLYDKKRREKYPPGPPAYPIFGSESAFVGVPVSLDTRLPADIHHMPRSRHCVTFSKWGEEYGPIVYLHGLGTKQLIINTYEAANDLLDKRGHIYSDRRRLYKTKELRGSYTASCRYDPL